MNRLDIPGLLIAVLVILKLVGTISISWFWVFSPVWITLGLIVVAFVVLFLIGMVSQIFS